MAFQCAGAETAGCMHGGGEGVVSAGGELTAPAIEAEIQKTAFALVEYRDRAGIARPDIVVRHVDDR